MKIKYNFMYYIAFFLLLLYSFNVGLTHRIYSNEMIKYVSLFLAGGLLFVLSLNNSNRKKKEILIILCCVVFLCFVVFRNADMARSSYRAILGYIAIILSFCYIINSKKWFKYFKIILMLFFL